MTQFVNAPTKGSLIALLKDPDNIGAREWSRIFNGVMFKDEFNRAISGQSDSPTSGASVNFSAYVRLDGTTPLTGNWDAGAYRITAKTLKSDVLTGTAPLSVASTTMVSNFNADLLDGQHGSHYAAAADYLPLAGGTMVGNIAPDASPRNLGNVSFPWAGIFVDNVNVFDTLGTDTISEYTGAAGVTIDSLLIKDSNIPDVDYDFVSNNDASTNVTSAELEELTDESETTLHSHGQMNQICLDVYVDIKSRQTEWNLHGGLSVLDTASALDSVPTDITVTAGIGKLMVVLNAGSDVSGSITVTGTSVNRNTGTETASDTDTLTVDALTTDGSDTDADGNTRHSFTGAYITSKWFKGSVTLSTTDLTLTDVDTYQVSFEQMNDASSIIIDTLDVNALANNASAEMYGYLYSLVVTGDKCDIVREASIELPAADVSANKYYRLRRSDLAIELDGSSDGFWVDFFPDPLNQNYWEDVNIKIWAGESRATVTGYEISGTITGSPPMSGVLVTLSGDASDTDTTGADGIYSFADLPPGDYTLTPTKTGYTFAPTSTAVTITSFDAPGKDFVGTATAQSWPVWYNFGGDTLGDTGTVLWAKNTHYGGRATATVRLDDYGVILAAAPSGIDQCFFGPGATSPYVDILLKGGEGWTPSDNGTIRAEMIIAGGGTGAQAYFYFQDSAKQEGVFFLLLGTGQGIVRTQGGGSLSGNLLSTSTGRTPFNWKYFSFQVSYGFGTKTCYYRLLPLNHSDWADTGWVNIGTIGSPTYASGTEMRHLQVNPYNSTTDQVALGQISLGQAGDSDNDGVVRTHNYTVP